MPPSKRKKKFAVKFELSPKGMIGATIVCLCIFLWMFLLGVWAGQTVLSTPPGAETVAKKATIKKRPVVSPVTETQPQKVAVTVKREVVKKQTAAKNTSQPQPEPEEDPSFFSVQVAAYKDVKLAEKAVTNWRSKGYDAFSRPPEGGSDSFTRVYIGRFNEMDAAKEHAELLKKKEKQKPFIALIPDAR